MSSLFSPSNKLKVVLTASLAGLALASVSLSLAEDVPNDEQQLFINGFSKNLADVVAAGVAAASDKSQLFNPAVVWKVEPVITDSADKVLVSLHIDFAEGVSIPEQTELLLGLSAFAVNPVKA